MDTPRPWRPDRGGRPGASLIETLALLILVGIVTALVLGRTDHQVELNGEAAVLKSNLRFAQAVAMSNNDVAWSVRLNAGSYQLLKDGVAAAACWPGCDSSTYHFDDAVTLGSGGGLVPIDQFGSFGVANRTLTLVSHGKSRSITLTGGTGYIE